MAKWTTFWICIFLFAGVLPGVSDKCASLHAQTIGVTGPVTVKPGSTTVYMVAGKPGARFTFSVTGGTIVNQGISHVTVCWDTDTSWGELRIEARVPGSGEQPEFKTIPITIDPDAPDFTAFCLPVHPAGLLPPGMA